jgi:RNA polymerase sigma-70 factor, ECF subfamily
MAPPPGDPLLSGLAAGRPEAFALLYDRLGPRLYRVARALLGSAEDAEDVVQDVFVALVRRRNSLGEVRNLDAYLFTALRHAALSRLGRRKSERAALKLVALTVPAAEDDRDDVPAPRGADLEAALASLPVEQREVLALKLEGELTFAQIGQTLGVSLNTAASRYRYALEKLRERLV